MQSGVLQVVQIEMLDDKSSVAIKKKKPFNPWSVSAVRSERISVEIDCTESLSQSVCQCLLLFVSCCHLESALVSTV